MSENNSLNLLSPTEALPKYHDDTPEQIIARQVYAQQVRRRLESLDASSMSFQGTGEAEIVVKVNGKAELWAWPIKPIPSHVLAEISAEYNACPQQIARRS